MSGAGTSPVRGASGAKRSLAERPLACPGKVGDIFHQPRTHVRPPQELRRRLQLRGRHARIYQFPRRDVDFVAHQKGVVENGAVPHRAPRVEPLTHKLSFRGRSGEGSLAFAISKGARGICFFSFCSLGTEGELAALKEVASGASSSASCIPAAMTASASAAPTQPAFPETCRPGERQGSVRFANAIASAPVKRPRALPRIRSAWAHKRRLPRLRCSEFPLLQKSATRQARLPAAPHAYQLAASATIFEIVVHTSASPDYSSRVRLRFRFGELARLGLRIHTSPFARTHTSP